tara:strand:- start:719 stop:1048 length:330 start_codon:yes stop_codon:yes gene_type:complete
MEFISFNNPYGIPEGSQFEPPKPTKKEFRYGDAIKYYKPIKEVITVPNPETPFGDYKVIENNPYYNRVAEKWVVTYSTEHLNLEKGFNTRAEAVIWKWLFFGGHGVGHL